MKKFLVVLLSVLMVTAMAACGKPAPKPLADDTHAAWVAHGQYLLADGTPNSWNGKDTALYEASALKAIALEDVKGINEALYNTLSGKEIKYLYTIDLILGVNDAGWTTNALIDGKLYRVNGSNAFKIAQCSVDADGDNKVYAEDQWISDPKTAHAESLTPDTLFMPVWQEENDEYGFSWASNPACIGVPFQPVGKSAAYWAGP
jgi:predicted small lipoprotein YifL